MSTYQDHLQQLQGWMVLCNYSSTTISAYRCALRQFLEWREAGGFFRPFEQGEARRYRLRRYRSGKKWQTVNGDYSAMRKFYEHALSQGRACSKRPSDMPTAENWRLLLPSLGKNLTL